MTTMPQPAAGRAGAPTEEDQLACLALALTPGLGPRRIYEALRGLDAASRVFALSLTELEGLRLPSQVRMELEAEAGTESKPEAQASLFRDPALRPEEAMVIEVLRSDEALQLDELLEALETQSTSSEVFTALFALEMSGRVRCLPGKN
jgi:predicted Rossmann fold nucleotide-binding protein DprA/Smf involved in DNA uptake